MSSKDMNNEQQIQVEAEKIQKRKTQHLNIAPKPSVLPALEAPPPAKKPKFMEKRAKVLLPVSLPPEETAPLGEITNFDTTNPPLLPLELNFDTDDEMFANAEVLQVLDTIE